MVPPASFAEYRKWLERQIEILNHAIEGIPQDRIRYHVCWGSWPGPHTTDVPLKDIVDILMKARVGAFLIEGANPRHEHEWKVFEGDHGNRVHDRIRSELLPFFAAHLDK
jgi:5-methyltetrahydropteroyltriglutamate--homocysteine methyltransferase